ncbi:MerR family transcriptional regulator [Pseudomonas sp. NCCP-436]|uniref:MerR family transcriptional regulator n=1 Tax=Pseudomonas sp. NCCP-436 TaxID=2842481 RepID=UPI001C825BF4|nr:MerR family transcriptional regulator [Pseudomonas sp. NCCP-436]GIZ10759.1 MerR family transcriptional regulator [Pseudomonas sp. NCCP-436]
MLLKVGELARRTGLTVRTLHHYDQIGLLRPSTRTEAGYRLYNRDDIARLHQIQALRGLGMPLAAIGTALERPGQALLPTLDRQIEAIEANLRQQIRLRKRLMLLRAQLAAGEEPALDDWLTTLELMSMYEQYFTQDELSRLPFPQASREWLALANEATALHAQNPDPASEAAQNLAHRWMTTLERDTAQNPAWLLKISQMHENEPEFQAHLGLAPEVVAFLLQAFGESKLSLLVRYLCAEEMAFTRPRYLEQMALWPHLLVELNEAIEQNTSPISEQGQALAGRWLAMFNTYAGPDPQTRQKIRQALAEEPRLAQGTWLSAKVLGFLTMAVQAAQPA